MLSAGISITFALPSLLFKNFYIQLVDKQLKEICIK